MRYVIDIKLTGYEEISVHAENEKDAIEIALAKFWEIYKTTPANELSHKFIESTVINTYE